MNLRKVSWAIFMFCCLVFEAFALASFYQTADLEKESETSLFSGNIYTWNNQGFSYHVYNRSSETLNVTASTAETASQRGAKYGESKAIFEITEDINKALDKDTVLKIVYQHTNINPKTSAIHFFVWAKNKTHQFRINYAVGYIEQDFQEGEIYFIFQNANMNSSTIYIRPWKTVVDLNITRNPLQMTKVGVKLIDYYWEEPNPLLMSVTIDLKKSYLLTYYDEAMLSTLHDYRSKLIQSSVVICATFLLMLLLSILLRRRLLS